MAAEEDANELARMEQAVIARKHGHVHGFEYEFGYRHKTGISKK